MAEHKDYVVLLCKMHHGAVRSVNFIAALCDGDRGS